MELIASKAARRLAETNASNSSKATKVAEARAVVALSCLIASEMKLKALPSKVAEMEVKMRNVMEKSKDVVFKKVEAIYLK